MEDVNTCSTVVKRDGHRYVVMKKQPLDLSENGKTFAEIIISILDILEKYKRSFENRPTWKSENDIVIEAHSTFTTLLEVVFYDANPTTRIANILRNFNLQPLLPTIVGFISLDGSLDCNKAAGIAAASREDRQRLESSVQTLLTILHTMTAPKEQPQTRKLVVPIACSEGKKLSIDMTLLELPDGCPYHGPITPLESQFITDQRLITLVEGGFTPVIVDCYISETYGSKLITPEARSACMAGTMPVQVITVTDSIHRREMMNCVPSHFRKDDRDAFYSIKEVGQYDCDFNPMNLDLSRL